MPTVATALMTPEEVAEFIGVKENTLSVWRYRGVGPRFVRMSHGLVRYRHADVEAWIEAHLSTEP